MSKLGLGCWTFGGDRYWGEQDHRDSVKTIRAALRGGITHFDTAAVYANGRSEQITGQQLKKVREDVIIATKSFYRPPGRMQKAIDTSLRRLCTDYIDIFYIHWPSRDMEYGPVMEVLEKNREAGKIGYIGISNFSVSGMETLLRYGKIDYCQTGYSLVWRKPEREIIPFCIENGIRIISYSSLGQGILTDKFLSSGGFLRDDDPRNRLAVMSEPARKPLADFLREVKKIAAENNLSLSQTALLWLMSKPWISSVLTGARNRKQIEHSLRILDKKLPEKTACRLTELSGDLDRFIPDAGNIFNHTP